MSHAQGQPDLDPDEDLFDFAGVKREAEPAAGEEDLEQIFASFRDAPPEEELLDLPSAPASADVAATGAPAPEASRTEAPARAPATPRTHVAAPPAALPTPRAARFSRSVVAIAGAVTLLNLVLAVVVLHGRPSEHDVRAVTSASGARDSDAHDGDAHAAPPHAGEASLPEPETVAAAHSHPALDAAREEISHGEYSAARQRVYGLLSIIDRLEDPRRSALEADCQFLIAQSLHLEALARMGGPR